MNTTFDPAQEAASGTLSIGELARATGVSAPTLRMWESRHGFPTARRLSSGHRRYDAGQVALVLDVVRRRELGARLDAAIEQVSAGHRSAPQSVYAELSRRHPEQPRQRLRKETLLALSWAIEDEIGASGSRGHLFGAFQEDRHFAPARARWNDLARTARSTYVYADFADSPSDTGPAAYERVHLGDDAPMRREWSVVHDSPELPVVLTAWELPGQADVPDRARLFESIWTLDPGAVRTAAHCCALIAGEAGHDSATALADGVLAGAPTTTPDALAVTRLAHRAVGYVDASRSRVTRG